MVGGDWGEGLFIKIVIKKDPIGKKPLGRSRLHWEDRIKKDFKAVEPSIFYTMKRNCRE